MDINKIISDNRGLIYKQLIRFSLIDDQDAESACYEALYKAAVTYSSSKNVSFSTYATVCIYNALCCHKRKLSNKRTIQTVSLHSFAPNECDSANTRELIDTIPLIDSAEDNLLKEEESVQVRKAIISAYNLLHNDTYRRVIFEWALSDFTAKQKDLSLNTGVSQASVSHAISVFKKLLREELKARDISQY